MLTRQVELHHWDNQWKSRPRRAWRFLVERGPIEVWRLARRHGLQGCARFVTRNLRYMLGDAVAKRFDRRYGVDTSGEIWAEALEVVGGHGSEGAAFMSTPELTFRRAMRHLPEDLSEFAFVDIGCGKGRAVLLAMTRNFRRVIGVDHAPDLVAIAQRNIEAWRGPRRCGDAVVVCADATRFELPDEPCVLYFFAPIDDSALLYAMIQNIAASRRARPRRMYAVYVAATDEELPDRAMIAAGFRPLPAPRAARFDPGATRMPLWYAVYESRDD